MNALKVVSVILLLIQASWLDALNTNKSENFGERINGKSLRSASKEEQTDVTRPSRRGNENANRHAKRENPSILDSAQNANVSTEAYTREMPEANSKTLSDGTQTTLSPFQRKHTRNRYTYLPRRPTRLSVPPLNLNKKSETETESDSREQHTWKHLLHSRKPFEPPHREADNDRNGSPDTKNVEKRERNLTQNAEEDAMAYHFHKIKGQTAGHLSDDDKVEESPDCTHSERKNCTDNNPKQDRNDDRSEVPPSANRKQKLNGSGSSMKLHIHRVWNKPSATISPSVAVGGQVLHGGELHTVHSPGREELHSSKGENTKPNRNTDIVYGSKREALTVTPKLLSRNNGATNDLNSNNGFSVSPVSLTSQYVHLDTKNFVTTPGPLASHRLEDWLENTTDTRGLPFRTTSRQDEPKTYGSFILPPPASAQIITESTLAAEQRSTDDTMDGKGDVEGRESLTSLSSEKLSTFLPFTSGSLRKYQPGLSDYFNNRRQTSKPYQRPPSEEYMDMHIYKATQDIIQKAELEERRKALFSSVRSSPIRIRLMSETQELDPRPREGTTDFSYSKIVNVTHSPKRDHQFVGKTQLHTPSPFRSQVQVSPFVPSASPIMRVITENRTSYMNAHNQLPQKEGNINKNFTKGYLMDRDSPVSKPVSPYHSQETRLLSPGFHRHRLNDPNQISSSGGKQVDVGLVENLDAPSTFRPFYSYLREHGIVADIFDGANNPSQFDNHSDLFDKIHDDKPEDNGLLPHSILYGTPVEHDKTTFKVHKLTSQDRATSGVSFEEPVFEVGTNGNLNQWQYNQNGNLDVFVKHTPSSTTSSKINSNAGMLQRDDNTYPGTPRPVSSSDTNVGAGLNLTIQKQHTLEQATYKQNDNTRLDNHRPLPKPLPPFYREQNSKDNFLRSSYVIFTPPGRVFAKSSTTAVPFPITTPSGATHNPLQLTIDNLPDPIHASSKETRVIVRGEDKFNTFSSPLKLPSSVISAPPPYYPPTEPSITLIPPAFIHPPTPLPDNIPPPPSLPQENKVTNTHENIITITDGGTTHFSKIHENDPNFVENNDFHGLINFELQNNNGNFQADQGSFVNQHHKTNVSPEHSLNEIKSSSVSNIEHDKNAFNSVHNTLYRQTPQQFTVTLSPNLRQEVTPNAVTKTEDPLNSFQNQNSDYPNNIMDDDNFPDAFASFEEAQLLDREKQENGNASPLVYKSAELIDDDHKENYKKEHSVEVSKPNFYDSHELLSHEIRSTQIGPDKRPYFVHDHPRPDHNHNNRRPPFLPDNRRPQYNKDTRRPPFITGSRHPEGSEEFRRPNFIQNFRGPHFSQERGRPQFHPESRRPLLNHGNRRPNFIQENRRPKFSHTGRPFHGSTEFDAFDEDSENRIPPHNSNARRPSLQPFPLELSHLKPPPEHLRPPPHSTISAEHAYLSGNDLSLNNLHSEEDEILNSSESIRNQQNGLKFSDNRQKYSDHNFPTSSSREKFQFRDHQANSFHSHQERPHFHPPSPNSHFSTSSGLRGHGHFHEPLHPSSHGSRHPHLRSEGKRPTPYSPPPPPPPPPSPPKPLGHHRSPPLPVITHIRNSNNPTRARPFPHGIRARRPFLYPDDISKETFPEVVRGSQEHSVEHSFHRGNNQQNSREKERARFPSSHEMENDFTPMREVSQPLPEDSRENRMLISESHAKMMKNMRYGIDGKPLDVWIPIVGKEVPKSKIASNGGERIQHESIRSNIPNQEKNHRDQPSIHNPHHDHSHRDKGSNLILDEYDYHNHNSREVDYLEYSHDDDDDYEYHEVNERDFKVKTNKDPPRENSDNDGITEEALSTTQISSPTNSYKGPRYNVINFPNVNIGSSGT